MAIAQTAIPFLVGTKYDHFNTFSQDEQEEITRQVRLVTLFVRMSCSLTSCPPSQAKRFSRAMKAPLIFCSTSHSINVQKIFKIVLSKGQFAHFFFLVFMALPNSRSLIHPLASGTNDAAFDLRCNIPEITETGEPLLIYADV